MSSYRSPSVFLCALALALAFLAGYFLGREPPAAAQAPWKGAVWEYRGTLLEAKGNTQEEAAAALAKQLDALGSQGWEYLGYHPKLRGDLFKRPRK